MKTPRAFPKLWHAMRAMKQLAVLGIALYNAVRAMQLSHEGELQLAILFSTVISTTPSLAWYKCLACKAEFAPGASAEAPRWCPVCGQPAPEKMNSRFRPAYSCEPDTISVGAIDVYSYRSFPSDSLNLCPQSHSYELPPIRRNFQVMSVTWSDWTTLSATVRAHSS
jgi:hypothetical protein